MKLTRILHAYSLAVLFTLTLFLAFSEAQVTMAQAKRANQANQAKLFKNPNVVATGISVDQNGDAIIKVYTKNANFRGIPMQLDNVNVHVREAGVIRAFDDDFTPQRGKPPKKGGDNSPRGRFARPVPIGVSIGSTGPSYCFAGTLGCRLKAVDLNSGQVSHYILSNNHVMAGENTGNVGQDGILQPGTLDNGCVLDPNDVIGTLNQFVPIKFGGAVNYVDAAIASTTASMTGFATPAAAYGAPTSNTVANPAINSLVQKYGRTTEYTQGYVDAVDVTVNVGYDAGTARFEDQVVIIGRRRRGKKYVDATFSDSGDSGSLIVSDPDRNPVGLLFAGNGSVTIANPINEVLAAFSDGSTLFMVDDGN